MVTACTSLSVELDEKGKDVALKEDLTEADLSHYEKVKYIVCEEGSNARALHINNLSCENFLRNEAGRVEANLVVIEKSDEKTKEKFGRCNNCVVLGGWSYRKKSPEAAKAKAQESEFEESPIRTPANHLQDRDGDDETIKLSSDEEPETPKRVKYAPASTASEPFQLDSIANTNAPSAPNVSKPELTESHMDSQLDPKSKSRTKFKPRVPANEASKAAKKFR